MKTMLLTSAAALLTVPAYSQNTSPDPAARAAPQAGVSGQDITKSTERPQEPAVDVAEIVVTGSRIRGTGPVGSNLIAIGAAQLARQPTATVADYLRKVPQIAGFGIDASSPVASGTGGTNTTRGSAINLRGVGTQATLTLLDGLRLPTSGVNGTYIDPTAIPANAIERIEVIADGASAVYGSDAVAGVVNFILRKDYDGLMIQGRYGAASDYWQWQAGAIAGKRWATGGFALTYAHSAHDNLGGGERSYVLADLRRFGGSDYRNTQCNPGNIVIGSTRYAIPAGGVTTANRSALAAGTSNRCENLSLTDILPRETRDSFVLTGHQQISDGLTARVEGLYTRRRFLALGVQQGSTTNIVNLTVPRTNPYFVSPVGTTPATETVEYDFTPELGLARQGGHTKDLRVSGGLDYEIAGDWRASADGFYGQDRSDQSTRRVNTTALTAALNSTSTATAFNPFGGGNSQTVLDAIYSGIFNPFATSTVSGATAQANGSLFTLPGGNVRLAVGGEFIRYGLDTGSRIGATNAPVLTTASQSRRQKSAFGELFVPLFGPNNARAGFERLDLSAAVRFDHYNDVGSTTNPKIGVNWSPVRGLLLKGSYGTSFRAPALQDLPLVRAGSSLAVSTWLDPLSPTGTSVGLALNAGNPTLKPETASTYSFTAQLQPIQVPGLTLSTTYFNINYKNTIVSPPRTNNSLLDPNYAFAVTRNPSNALIQSYLDQGFTISGTRPGTVTFFYNAQAINSGSISTDGLDFSVAYNRQTNIGQITVGIDASYVLNYKLAVTSLASSVQEVGLINFPVRFRGRTSLGWSRDGFSAELTTNFVGRYRNNLVNPSERVKSWTTFDLHLGYEFQTQSGLLHGFSVSIDGTNIFDRRPPFVNILNGFDAGQASALGRFFALTLTKKI